MSSTPVDYSFMKSGLGFRDPGNLPIEQELSKQVVSVICALVEKSLHTAMFYMEKAGRKTMTETDLMYAIKYETSVFLDDTDTDERIREFYSVVSRDSDNSDTDSDSVDSSNETIELEEQEFQEANDEIDEKIRAINHVNHTWDTFQPTDMIKQILKDSIDKMIERIRVEGLDSLSFEINL